MSQPLSDEEEEVKIAIAVSELDGVSDGSKVDRVTATLQNANYGCSHIRRVAQ